MGRGPGVRAASASSIKIDFRYRGVRCREKLKLAPTPQNLRFAKRLKATIEHEIAIGTFDYARHFPNSKRAAALAKVPGSVITIGEMLDLWLPTVRDIEPETRKAYANIIEKQLKPKFGTIPLAQLTRTEVKQWIRELQVSLGRLHWIMRPLLGAFSMALEELRIPANPLVDLELAPLLEPPDEDDDVDPFTPAEVAAILPVLPAQTANLVETWVWTGMRPGELIALTWADVDFERGIVRVTKARRGKRLKGPKTRAGIRDIRLLPPAAEALKRQKLHTRLAGKEIFHHPRTSAPWSGSRAIAKIWPAALKRAGIRYRYPYQLRHTYASWMLSGGENVMWVAKQMGHKHWTITAKIYSRWMPSFDPDAGMRAFRAVKAQR